MKKMIAICLLTFTFVSAKAIIHTLDNSGRTGAQHATFESAVDAASDGDTIYIYPSSIDYINTALDKRVHIIGTGHRTEIESNKVAKFSSLTIRQAGSGSTLESIEITNGLILDGNTNISDPVFHIKNCKIGAITNFSATAHNIFIEGCVFPKANNQFATMGSASTNWIFTNNIFYNNKSLVQGFLGLTAGVTLTNNLFLMEKSPIVNFFTNCNSTTITNNIFIFHEQFVQSDTLDLLASCNNCIFSNNAVQTLDGLPIFLDPSYAMDNNIIDANIVFQSSPNGLIFAYNHNFDLAPTSDGNNAGLDGTDLGVFGLNFNFRINGYSNNFPRISSVDAPFQAVPLNEPVQIDFKAKRAGL